MPQLSDLLEKKKKFIKKSYRPWDLSGSGTVDYPHSPVSNTSIEENKPAEANPPVVKKYVVRDSQLPAPYSSSTKRDNKSGNETGNNQVTTREQTDNNQVTEKIQPDNNQVTARQQTGNVTDNVLDNTNNLFYLIEAIKKLTGIQKDVFLYLVNTCTARGTLDTGNLLSSDLAEAAHCSVGSAKTSLNRLIEKRLVLRLQGKACRGGHLVLGITKEIQAAAIQAKQALFNPLKNSYPGNITGNVTDNTTAYSSSIYNNKTTTTSFLSDEWKNINFEALQQIGFSETQLRQLFESSSTTPAIVQESINHFAFALQFKEKVKEYRDPLNVLMGVLRKGQSWYEADYVSPQELALQKILDEKRKRKDKLDSMIKELMDLEFPAWRKQITDDEVRQIVPAHTLKTNLTPAITAALKSYFTENILFPRLKKDGVDIF